MAKTITVEIDSRQFERFLRQAPKEARSILSPDVKKTAFIVGQRIKAKAAVGPVAPHIKDDIEVRGANRGSLIAKVGFWGGPSGGNATQPEVALYNEYRPNQQPFMRPAADDEANDFGVRITRALKLLERRLTVGAL